MDSVNNRNMVEIFSNGVTTCIAPQDIADRFSNELTDAERIRIIDGFVEDQDAIGNGPCRYTFAETDGRGIDLKYFSAIEYRTGSKLVYLRVTALDVSVDSDSGVEMED
jgi:hypothetical protein